MADEQNGDEAGRRTSRNGAARAKPWNIGSLVPWSAAATLGDPGLMLVPMAAVVFGIIAVLGAGAGSSAGCAGVPGCPAHILVPLWSLPPFDAYQDAGVIGLAASAAPAVWAMRAVALVLRAGLFGLVAHLALQRAHDRSPDSRVAAKAVAGRWKSILALELASFGAFGIPLLLAQGSVVAAGRPVSQLGALVGQVILTNAFFAAFTERGAATAFRSGLRWVTRKPLGHLGLAVLATSASNGVFWLSRAGEAGRPSDLALGLYSLLHAVITTVFLVAFARRWLLLYQGE